MSGASEGKDPYVAAQIAARQRSSVIKMKFLNFRSKFPEGQVFAVEGDDDKIVYSYWISRVFPSLAFEFFICLGKREVRNLCNSLHADLSGSNREIAYLVDRDFDDLAGFDSVENVFMLDRYSIENYLVERDVLSETVKVAFPGSGDPAHREALCEVFQKDYMRFLEIVAPLNRRVFFARKTKLDIDDLMPDSLSKLATVALGEVIPCEPPAEDAIPPHEPRCAASEELHLEFDALDPPQRYRGKFSYKFLRSWLDRLSDEYRNPKLGFFPPQEAPTAKIKHDEMSLGALAYRSRLPHKLDAFLSETCCAS